MQLRRGNLFLVGLPGSGKSTLGRSLARRLELRFIDADVELEARLGVTIATIFEVEGEESFRARETEVLADITAQSGVVIATGGGVVQRAQNREYLAGRGTVIYLHAKPQAVWERTRRSGHRPLLNTADRLARLHELYAVRDSLYREVADLVIESDRSAMARVVSALAADAIPREADDAHR
jgi:shikimate kinase